MTVQALTRIMNTARVKLPGALDTAMKYELYEALDEFCQESSIWKENIDFAVNIIDLEYQIVPTDGYIVRLVMVQNSDDFTVAATMETPGLVVFQDNLSAVDIYTARVIKSIVDPVKSDGFPVIPEWILIKYNAAISEGLVARMMSQAAKPYTNERLAIYHARRWRNAMAKAATDSQHMNLHNASSWQFPRWA